MIAEKYSIKAEDFRRDPNHEKFLDYFIDMVIFPPEVSPREQLICMYAKHGISVTWHPNGYIEEVHFDSYQAYVWFLLKWT